jgi:hypothetical protein
MTQGVGRFSKYLCPLVFEYNLDFAASSSNGLNGQAESS